MVKSLTIPTGFEYNYNDKCCLAEPSLKRNIVPDAQRTQKNTNCRRRMHLIHLDPSLPIDSLCKKPRLVYLLQEWYPQLLRREYIINKALFMFYQRDGRPYFCTLRKHLNDAPTIEA